MKVGRNPFIVFGAFILVFWVLLWAGPWGSLIVEIAFWSALGTMSAIAVFKTVRRGAGRRGTYGQDAALPEAVRRWVFDEPGPETHERSGNS